MKVKIQNLAKEYYKEMVEIRRHLHTFPEISLDEYKTADFISKKLEKYKIKHSKNVAKTGIVAIIEGKNPKKRTIALRADMDALSINEENKTAYTSKNKGIMHACGHDAHMACLLGASKILNEIKSSFEGSIKIIFQPSEETFPGGALMMINEKVLENPKPDIILGMHVMPTLEVGKVGMKSGKYMASTDEIYLTIKGKGGHAATPELNVDTVLIASHIVVALQQLISRNANPTTPSVLSFGKFIANGRTNIIPNEVKIDGTFRTFDEKWRADAHKRITKMAKGIANSMGGDCIVDIHKGYPFLINDDKVTRSIFNLSQEYLGKKNVKELEMRMTSEDFAYFSQKIPSCFYRLGVMNEKKGITSNLHTSTFDIDETSLEIGMGLMAWLAFKNLSMDNN